MKFASVLTALATAGPTNWLPAVAGVQNRTSWNRTYPRFPLDPVSVVAIFAAFRRPGRHGTVHVGPQATHLPVARDYPGSLSQLSQGERWRLPPLGGARKPVFR